MVIAGQFKQGNKNLKLLNFNTTLDTPNTEKGNQTLAGWAEYIMNNWVARASKSPIYEAKAILGEDYVFDVSPSYKKKLEMDDVSDKNLNLVIEIWQNYYEKVKPDLLAFMKR